MKNFLFFIGVVLIGIKINAQSPPPGFSISDATNAPDWEQAVGAVFSNDGSKLFVWEKRGHVYLCNRNVATGKYTKQIQPVINIADEVGNWNDFGLVGFALDPDFSSNGNIYLYYVVDRHHLLTGGLAANGYNPATNNYKSATIGRITKYSTLISGGNLVVDPASRNILLGETKSTGIPILHNSHGVGSLAFAADGTLLATSGDGASYDNTDAGEQTNIGGGNNTFYVDALADGIIRTNENVGAYRSQLLNSHNGKLLRINSNNGDGISSNPFFDETAPRSAKSRVYAFGFRNPFRMSVKPGAGSTNPSVGDVGEIFIGDVGWGAWEELNIVKRAGTNFGWPLYEGSSPVQSYNDYGIENRDETYFPNCRPTGYMTFNKMIVQDNADEIANLHNPCDVTQINATGRRYLHARPVLDWGRNPGNTRVSRYNSSGVATTPTIGTPESNVVAASTFTGNASTGGVWFTNANNAFPPEYSNTFLLSDFGAQMIKRIGIAFTDVVTSVDDFVNSASTVVSMAENPLDGSLVYVTVGTLSAPSTVKRIIYGGNVPPVAKISANNYFSSTSTLSVNYTGSDSYDQDGTVATYSWDFGDVGHPDNLSSLPNPSHTYVAVAGIPRKYVVKLTVTDNLAATSEEEKFIVSVNNTPPQVNIVSPVNNSKYQVGSDTIYSLMANVTDAEQGPGQLTYAWQTGLIHNNHSHPGPIDPDVQTTTNISRIGCNGDNYHWKIQLTVTDDAGLSTTAVSEIFPNCETALPLILHKFSVTQKSSVNLVKWTTELESNIEFFEVERSTDGVNFSPINRQNARNVAGASHYSFSDDNFSPGYNYYRLKMVEHGSIIRYSVIVRTVSEEENLKLKIVPNPVVGNFSVMYKSFQDDRVTIRIRDITGRVLHTLSETVSRGQNVIYLQNLPNWPAGVYFLSIQNKEEIKQTKFIKAR